MKKKALFFLFILYSFFLFGDLIILKNGNKIEGEIITDSNNLYMIKTPYDTQFIESKDVRSVVIESPEIKNNRRLLHEIEQHLKKAEIFSHKKHYPQCLTLLDICLNLTLNFTGKHKETIQKTINQKMSNIHTILKNNHITLYKELMINSNDYEIHKNKTVFQNLYWVNEICTECEGNGNINCYSCEGSGYYKITCNRCNAGNIPCDACKNKGFFTCSKCKGRTSLQCPHCQGSKKMICPHCSGKKTGQKGCETCGGSPTERGTGLVLRQMKSYNSLGYIISTEVEQTCHRCQGKGFVYEVCPECRGEGASLCPHCQGKGTIQCDLCAGAGIIKCKTCDGEKVLKCPDCFGLGFHKHNCEECKGKKQILCHKCSGKGYFGDKTKIKIVSPADITADISQDIVTTISNTR